MHRDTFSEGRRHGVVRRTEFGTSSLPSHEEVVVPETGPLFKYIFHLQGIVEKERMDYHVYAKKMWEQLVGSAVTESKKGFKHFESAMVQRLHGIPMAELVYPAVTESFKSLVEKYGSSIRHLSLWSTGDVEATGYQNAKISRSRVVESFYKSLVEESGKPEAKKFLKEKTSYLVRDDKVDALARAVSAEVAKQPEGTLRVVVIEDFRKNFSKAEKAIHEALGEDAMRVELVPIWATYSREGKQARQKSETEFIQDKERFNGIDSFADLTEKTRFAPLLKDAVVFVDFDGVIGNNEEMRRRQAVAIASSLAEGVSLDRELSISEGIKRLTENAQNVSGLVSGA